MARQRATINVTGMNRDMAKSRFDPRFSFENKNIRVSARDEQCTSFVITNERGPKLVSTATVHGTPVGVFECDKYFGVFSFSGETDYITVYKKDGDDISQFFCWSGKGLDFDEVDTKTQRIETEVSVEASNSIRVYWVDGVHQPRVIDFMKLRNNYGDKVTDKDIDSDHFGFLPVVKDISSFKVDKRFSGYYYTGTVQFAVSEVINGNESNLVYYSPLYYASDDANNRGFAPDNQTTGCSFDITFSCADYEKVDYFIVYAIHRATQNGAPVCVKREMQATGTVRCTIAGSEEAVDASHVLLLNRQPMTGAKTIQQKDGVLFVANWHNEEMENVELKFNTHTIPAVCKDRGGDMQNATMSESGAAMNSQLKHNSYEIGHFKKGEKYLLGVQFMDKYGYWGEPILVKKYTSDRSGNVVVAKDENGKEITLHEMTDGAEIDDKGRIVLPYFSAGIAAWRDFKKVRPVIAYIDDAQKPVLYQGFVTPTIYCEKERVEGSCYAKLSPFTRSFKVFEDGKFKPSKYWCNPRYVVCSSGEVPMHADVYFKGGTGLNKGHLVTFDGYGLTSADADPDFLEKDSMIYGTYPASQHLQQLGCVKDYNGEFQTSWRFRDVVFKTALVPNDVTASVSDDENAQTVKQFTITFNVYAEWRKVHGRYLYDGNLVVNDYIFVGKRASDNKPVLLNYSNKTGEVISDDVFDFLYNEEGDTDKSENALAWLVEYVWGNEKETDDNGNATNNKINSKQYKNQHIRWDDETENIYVYEKYFDHPYSEGLICYADKQSRNGGYNDELKFFNSRISDFFFGTDGALKTVFGAYKIEEGSVSSGIDDASSGMCTLDNSLYFVDAQTVTFHSPDIREETSIKDVSGETKVRFVGASSMDGFSSDTSVVASSGKYSEYAAGTFGFQNIRPGNNKSGRCAMNLPNWASQWDSGFPRDRGEYWAVPPFGVEDFLATENNEKKIENKQTSKLDYHQLSNYRFCGETAYFKQTSDDEVLKASVSSAFGTSTPITILDSKEGLIYKSSEDTLINPSLSYFWSNGPLYYERDRSNEGSLSSYFSSKKQEGRIFYNISKFKNWSIGKIWQQLGYSTIWLAPEDLGNLCKTNYTSLMTVLSSCKQRWNRGYWHNGGTVEKAKAQLSASGQGGIEYQEMSYEDDKFGEWNMNSIRTKNGWKRVNLDSYGYDSDYGNGGAWDEDDDPRTHTVALKYDSSPHVVMRLERPLDNYTELANYAYKKGANVISKGWKAKDDLVLLDNKGWKNGVSVPFPNATEDDDYLWVVDIVNNDGDISADPHTAQWMIGGEAVDLNGGTATVEWVQGNWYFQRYDCLRTFPNSITEKNQVVEIVSFMCETRRNLDGRYDSHAGKAFLQANRTNFNLINDAYTQLNNFFSYSMPSANDNVVHSYPNTVTWSIPKTLNANVDAWTSITGASILDMEGDKGDIVHITRFANSLFCFQPSGISQIRYNEQTSISTENGTPLELAMNGKVDGKLYVSTSAGACSNVNVCTTDSAIYFVDQYNKTMNIITGEGAKPVSEEQGFHSWFATRGTLDHMKLMYDRKNKCVMAVDNDTALVYNELTGVYESFMSYENTFETVNVQNKTLLLHRPWGDVTSEEDDGSGDMGWLDNWKLYDMNKGEYNIFFGKEEDFWIDTLISGSPSDKVFDNVEFRGDLYDGNEFAPRKCPFNYIRAYNEYQDSGKKVIKFDPTYTSYRAIKQALMLNSNAKNRFRAWHLFVPRNALIKGEYKAMYMADRMRNPWCHIVLGRSQSSRFGGVNKDRAEIQDINVDYTE